MHTPQPPDEFSPQDEFPEDESLEAQFNPITNGDAPVFSSEDEYLDTFGVLDIPTIFNPVTQSSAEQDEDE